MQTTELTADQYFNVATKALKQFDFESIVAFDWNNKFNTFWLYKKVFGFVNVESLIMPIEAQTKILRMAFLAHQETNF